MNKVIKAGTVFANNRAPNTHNEIVKVYMSRDNLRGRNLKMVDVEQYGTTLENKDVNRKITFFASEITGGLRRGIIHLVLVRQ